MRVFDLSKKKHPGVDFTAAMHLLQSYTMFTLPQVRLLRLQN